MKQNGSRERVLGNPDLAMQLAAQIEGRDPEEDKANQETGKAKDSSKPAVLADGELAFNRSELRELKQPLEKILQDSLPYYEKKLQAQMKVIEDQIARSTQQILNRLEAGSYEKIGQPDIRILWKDMVWFSILMACFSRSMSEYSGVANVCQGQTICYGPARPLSGSLRRGIS